MTEPISSPVVNSSNRAIRRVQISSLGTHVPPRVMTNEDLEKKVVSHRSELESFVKCNEPNTGRKINKIRINKWNTKMLQIKTKLTT